RVERNLVYLDANADAVQFAAKALVHGDREVLRDVRLDGRDLGGYFGVDQRREHLESAVVQADRDALEREGVLGDRVTADGHVLHSRDRAAGADVGRAAVEFIARRLREDGRED